MKKLLLKLTGNEKQKLNRYGFTVLIMVVGLLFFNCKKDTIETPSEPLPSNPQVSLDYRDSFVGTYKGIYFNYNRNWYPPVPLTWTYSEGAATNYTIHLSKVAGQGNDSLVYSNEILFLLTSINGSNYSVNDTFLLRSNGLYNFSHDRESAEVKFFDDSLNTNRISWQGAMGSFGYGIKFKGKK